MRHFETIYLGDYSVKIAKTEAEINEAQRLRYLVFYQIMQAKASDAITKAELDFDDYDDFADHLLVRFHQDNKIKIVGTYRLIPKSKLPKNTQFYSSAEYDISKLINNSSNIMELGRSCTHPEHRSKVAMQLLWRGIGEYILQNKIEYMFGCASFSGCNPVDHAESLSYLYHNHLAPEVFLPSTLPQFYSDMNMMQADKINNKRTFMNLPPLIKGYLRLGGVVGDGAFIDYNFNTTDILMIVQTSEISAKYMSKFSPDSIKGGAQ
jgi:L-ornithine Nalpha-acyltransferase